MNLIILDRDGTINEDRDDYIKSADEWVPLPGALEAIARLNQGGWEAVTNASQNLSNMPVEVMEAEHPVRIEDYSFVPDS